MQQSKDNQREDVELAYIAGLIDGEGSIIMGKFIENKWSPKYTPKISFVNTNRESVELISKFLGYTKIIEHYPSRYGYPNRKICYKTAKCGRTAVSIILKRILPYLRIKKRQAELLIEYDNGFQGAIGNGWIKGKLGGRTRTEEENQRREIIYQELKKIHGYITRND